MFNEAAEWVFIIGGLIVALLGLFRLWPLSSKESYAAATAATGLILCGRYAALIQSDTDRIFTVGVGAMMFILAYNSFGLEHGTHIAAE